MHHQQPGQNLPPSASHVQPSPFAQSQTRGHGLLQHANPQQMQSNQAPMIPSNQQGMQKVHSWTQQHHFVDSGVQSMTPSTAMSSAVSVMSGTSSMQDEYAGPNLADLTDTQQRKFDNIPSEFTSHQPFGANQADRDPNAIANAIPDLIGLLDDSDEVVVEQAAMMVRKFVKLEAKQPFAESVVQNSNLVMALWKVLKTHRRPEIINTVLWALFHISMRSDGLEKLKQIVESHNGQFIVELLAHLSSETAYKPALMTLHNLLQESSKQGSTACRLAQQANGLRAVVNLLDGNNEKFLSIAVDCARLLYRQSPEQKIRFLQAGGPMKLVNILRVYQHENLLATTTRALLPLSNCTQNARAIVEAGGIQALQLRLDHGSQRLVSSSLDCLRNLSDVPTGDMDITDLLRKLLHLLAGNDGNVVLYCVWILSNMCANNKLNKEYLCKNNAHMSFIRVLQAASNGQYVLSNVKSPAQHQGVMEDVQEGALAAIRQLCVGHDGAAQVQLALLNLPGAAELYLSKLVAMRPAVLKQMLQVLNKAAAQDQNLPTFRDTKIILPNEQRDTDFCEQITCVLRVACFSIDLTEVENVKVADLIWLSMSTLQHLAADDVMFRRILILMKSPDFAVGPQRSLLAPLFVLSHPHCNENIQRSALGLLNELTTDQEIATLLLRDQNYVAMFDHFANSQIQANATYAIKLLEKLNAHHQRMSGGVNDRPPREEFYQPQAVWNEEQMGGATGGDDPFANVFYQQSQMQQQRPPRASGGAMSYDPSPMMDSMHLGSPASPWHSGTHNAPPYPAPSASNQFGGYQ